MVQRVKIGEIYKLNPCLSDSVICQVEGFKPGDIVQVIHKPSCSKPGIMGFCYVEKDDIIALIRLRSLEAL